MTIPLLCFVKIVDQRGKGPPRASTSDVRRALLSESHQHSLNLLVLLKSAIHSTDMCECSFAHIAVHRTQRSNESEQGQRLSHSPTNASVSESVSVYQHVASFSIVTSVRQLGEESSMQDECIFRT